MTFSPKTDNEMFRELKVNTIDDQEFNLSDTSDEQIPTLVVSFAGGGSNGIGSLEMLRVLDEKLVQQGAPHGFLLKLLNHPNTIVAGTSTGSIIASLLKSRHRINPDTGKLFTIQDYKDLYYKISPKLFTPNSQWLKCLCCAPFSRKPLVRAANRYLGAQKIDHSPGLVIMAFNKTESRSEFISDLGDHPDYTVADSAQASTAIPCAFSPKTINGLAYSDGGTCITSLHPTLEAIRYYSEKQSRKNMKDRLKPIVIDFGAGISVANHVNGCIKPDNRGGLINTLLDGTCCEVVQHLLRSGPEMVDELDYELYSFDFPSGYPLAFTESCLDSTVHSANLAVINDTEMKLLVSRIVEAYLN